MRAGTFPGDANVRPPSTHRQNRHPRCGSGRTAGGKSEARRLRRSGQGPRRGVRQEACPRRPSPSRPKEILRHAQERARAEQRGPAERQAGREHPRHDPGVHVPPGQRASSSTSDFVEVKLDQPGRRRGPASFRSARPPASPRAAWSASCTASVPVRCLPDRIPRQDRDRHLAPRTSASTSRRRS